MPFLKRREQEGQNAATLEKSIDPNLPANPELPAQQKVTFIAVFMGLVASIGGFMFGYASGQISGYFLMEDFQLRFAGTQPDGSHDFNAVRQGTITSMLCAGSAIGALVAGQIADSLGRKYAISASALWCCIGTIIEISSDQEWAQFAVGRGVNGIGIGSLSVLVPMYQSESAPAVLRGILVSCYQLFVTFGIWTSNMINYGTEDMQGSASWRIPNGVSFIWALILGAGILFLPESPRFAYRQGREEEARNTIARYAGVATDSRDVNVQLTEIRVKLEEERAGADTHWWEIFTGPKMFYRTMIGVILQAGQQLTGANFFFYYGTTIFNGVGLKNSYVAQIILGTVNVVCTFGGLYVAQKCGRRKALIFGAGWIAMCFFIYSFVGHFLLHEGKSTQAAGNVLIVFSCFAIASFASTWGPLVWAVVAEMYPARYRAPCMALATASNWIWNFLISFFTRFITGAIDYLYGLVFAGCCIALMFIVFFFVIESKDRSLEEIDTMYLLGVNPITSANWDGSKVPHSEDNTPGASGRNSSEAERGQSVERTPTRTVEE
ncbi:general substrate transporter [Hortaea werneckii]|uniref:Major facilitator superfamily (MFS) profile domain-containing protein n=1 Tax=Hortaea werneckii TaxID=91943 RepID=A0A3M7FFR9_HORWE|nr:general substrate transporter [Hortaea werneckii]KAI6885020.1 general substrate transporter [Hortaea werneckii]KAI6994590.1 general substrate transporter [Hortaea werneckii]KAI7146258.1 general substrate transporter [Hortaea werneckii]KAI7175037.1 general substrate transporter [Hortaea werneckii]